MPPKTKNQDSGGKHPEQHQSSFKTSGSAAELNSSSTQSSSSAAAAVEETEDLGTKTIDDEVEDWIIFEKQRRRLLAWSSYRERDKMKKKEMEEENDKYKKENEEYQSRMQDMQTAMEENFKKLREQQTAKEEWMRLLINQLIGHGQDYSVAELEVLFMSQPYGHVGEGSNYHNLSLHAAGPSTVADHHLQAPNNYFSTHNPAAGFSAFPPGTSSAANQNLFFGNDFDNHGGNDNPFIHYGHDYGYDASAPGTSSVANQNFFGNDFDNNGVNDIGFIEYGPDYGFLTTTAAGFSAPNNPADSSDFAPANHQPGFPAE